MNLLARPTTDEWELFALLFASITVFIAAAELLRRAFRGSPEITRKSVHILTGVLIYFAPQLFTSGVPAILLALIFIAVNYTAIRLGLLKGMHGTNRVSYGTVYYPVSFLILVLVFWDAAPFVISLSILILALGDAAAAIVGENLRSPHEYRLTSDKKSYEGSLAMFVTTTAVTVFGLRAFGPELSWNHAAQVAFAVGLFATAWEAISSKGFDNLTIPLGASLMIYYFFMPDPAHDLQRMFHGTVLGAGISLLSLRLRFLSPSGSIATFLLAATIYGLGGWRWTVPILVFFVASSLLSKYEKSRKRKYDTVFEKTDKRDEGQVAANGGVAGLLLVASYAFPGTEELYLLYIAAIAAATADTWGTEIGILGKGRPVSIVSFRRVEPGTSGGVSFIGLIGGMAGAALIALTAAVMDPETVPFRTGVLVVAAGMAGALTDSLLGATLQAQYRTREGKLTERTVSDGVPNELAKGIRWFDNDIVNWACAAAGPLALWLML